MADKDISLESLREQAAQARSAWAKIPVANILTAVMGDVQSQKIQDFVVELRPLFDALPPDEPSKQHIGSLIGLLNSMPTMLQQRLDQLAR